ncbi:MAG: hypothetical protein WAO91_02855 [Candidatus Nitrosotenuis sp.]
MANDPFEGDVKPLTGLSGVFRKSVGDYRIAFSVNFAANEVLIIKIAKKRKGEAILETIQRIFTWCKVDKTL